MTYTQAVTLAIGTYDGGGGRGLRMLSRDPAGTWSPGDVYPDARNASFGIWSSRFDLHYLVDERDGGAIGVHRHGPAGWEQRAHVPVGGDAPCHIALNHAQSQVAVANYASGSVALFALDPATGLPLAPAQVWTNRGSGPDPDRQDAPHVHWVGFGPDDHWLYATDLGTDEILAFPVAPDGAMGAAHTAYAAPPGSGPRHLLLHPHLPGIAYLACELSSSVTMLTVDGATMRANRTLSTLPAGWHGPNILAHITTDRAGDRLYVSNRGHDSIAVFALDASGVPRPIRHVATGGRSPRHVLLLEDERCMVVAHERDQTVTMLALDAGGLLHPGETGVPVPGAAFVFALR